MTEPQPVMDQAEQDQLTRQVGRALLKVAGEGWKQVRAEYRSAGRHIEVDVFVTGPDGETRPVRPPVEVVEGLGKLRQGMYRPGRGTWLSALYVIDPPSSFSAEFEPDVEPRWRRMPPPIGFADELRFFPRSGQYIPDWLLQRAGLRPQGEPTPPGGLPGRPGTGRPGGPEQPGGHAQPSPGIAPWQRGQPPQQPDPRGGEPHPGQPGPPGQPGTPPGGFSRYEPPIPAQSGQPGGPPPPGTGPRPGFPPQEPPPHGGPFYDRPPYGGPHGDEPPQPGMPPNGGAMSFRQFGTTGQPAW